MGLDYDAIAARYQSVREIGVPLNTKLVRLLSRDDINSGARTLGLLRDGDVLVLGAEHELSVLMDYCIHSVLVAGKNLIDRCLDSPADFTLDETCYMMAMAQSHYSAFSVDSVQPGAGIHAIDLFREGDRIFIADLLFSQTADPGMLLAGRLTPLPGFFMTTGAALPILPESCEGFKRLLLQDRKRALPDLPRKEEAELSGAIIRLLLQNNSSAHITYGREGEDEAWRDGLDPGSDAARDDAASFDGQPGLRKIGRNAPCPCGSGKKYKKCCGRQ
jgi:hypothetical protein